MLISSTPLIFKRKFFFHKIRIIPTSNNSQTNVRNVVKICFLAICEVSFTISLKNLVGYIEKWKLGWDPHVEGVLRKDLKYQIEVDNNSWLLGPFSLLYGKLH